MDRVLFSGEGLCGFPFYPDQQQLMLNPKPISHSHYFFIPKPHMTDIRTPTTFITFIALASIGAVAHI